MEDYEAVRNYLIRDIKIHHDLFETWAEGLNNEERIKEIQRNERVLHNIIMVIEHSRIWPDNKNICL